MRTATSADTVSYAIVDCASHDRVMAIAARIVDNVGDTVEVRPVMEGSPADETAPA